MDAVIGIALTATTAGVTLASGDGVPHPAVDGVTVSLDEGRSPRAQLAAAVRRIYAQGAKRGCRARTVAVTWTADADDHAVGFSGLPAELDVDLLPIPLASAGSALVSDTGSTDTVVCVLEPDVERRLRGCAVVAGTDEPRAVVASGLYDDDAAGWLAGVLGGLDRQPQRLVLIGADEHAHPVAAELPDHIRVDSEGESILALAHGAALASARDAAPGTADGTGPERLARKPAWLAPVVLAAMVLVSGLVATMPLGSAGPSPAPAPPPARRRRPRRHRLTYPRPLSCKLRRVRVRFRRPRHPWLYRRRHRMRLRSTRSRTRARRPPGCPTSERRTCRRRASSPQIRHRRTLPRCRTTASYCAVSCSSTTAVDRVY
ncbi:hypothetical protein [Mycolicibacterium sp. NCC-Tsukiji]|uniref:hypothetical protein n=1 Tax=Mycolicibacterium sp. NCC-Tsukiji TaxID=2185272 RepID=UPI00107F36C2|nr:hypothetical protein [Mycolicibacterium sp. NCC-Tsukiji]